VSSHERGALRFHDASGDLVAHRCDRTKSAVLKAINQEASGDDTVMTQLTVFT
jgi:hypothetical protein